MGIIERQAKKNSVFIVIGFIAGAINTLFVLPRAFENNPEDWGFIAVITAYAMVAGQILSMGTPNSLVRFVPKMNEQQLPQLLGYTFRMPLIAISLGLLALLGAHFTGIWEINFTDALSPNMQILALTSLTFFLTFFVCFGGYVQSILKTTQFQFLQETFQKGAYLLLAVTFFYGCLTFEIYTVLYVAIFAVMFCAIALYSRQQEFRMKFSFDKINVKEIRSYSFYSVPDKSASVLLNRLDQMMIAGMLALDQVAFYTLAFYIGSVSMFPGRSLQVIANPIAAKAIANDDREDLKSVYQKTSLTTVMMGGAIFIAIWAGLDDFVMLLPEKFRGAKWVVFYIGISKIFNMIAGISGGIIVYSKHYRVNLLFNAVMLVLTIITNYLFMSERFFDMGIEGAALATAISIGLYTLAKIVFIRKHFHGITPLTKGMFAVLSLIGILIALVSKWHFTDMSWLSNFIDTSLPIPAFFKAAINSGLFFIITILGLYLLRVSSDFEGLVNRLLRIKK